MDRAFRTLLRGELILEGKRPWVPSLVWCWAVLVGLTVLSVGTLQDSWLKLDHRLAGTAAIGLAFVKVWIVGLNFMELRHAPAALRRLFEGWIVAVCCALSAIYWA